MRASKAIAGSIGALILLLFGAPAAVAQTDSRPPAPPPPAVTVSAPQESPAPVPVPTQSAPAVVLPVEPPVPSPAASPIVAIVAGSVTARGTSASVEAPPAPFLALTGAQIALFAMLGLASITLGAVLARLGRSKRTADMGQEAA
ncbi:MAG: hypothetical protein ACRD1T_10140 [Acidimicrobiia bacterium]